MKWMLPVTLLLSGCSVFFGVDPSPECTELTENMDGDAFVSIACGGTDCNDNDRLIYPGAPERCNYEDDNCDGREDEFLETMTFFADCDGDGIGSDDSDSIVHCERPNVATVPPVCQGGEAGAWVEQEYDCDDHDVERTLACGGCAQVDFLIVMDTSNSMAEEQIMLAAQIGDVVHALKTGEVPGGAVLPGAEPIVDLHVAVITPDLGTGPFTVPTCSAEGDDAVMRDYSGAPDPACEDLGLTTNFLAYDPSSTDEEALEFQDDWSCLIRAGIGGCAFEQPLEAALKALTPARSSLRFSGESLGHGDGLNGGFLRDDSLLMVLFVTDEDDCSAYDTELYNPGTDVYPGDLNLRCHDYPDALHPLSRFVGGLLQLRDAEDIILGTVSGVPGDLLPAPPSDPMAPVTPPNYSAILADSRMQETIHTSRTRLNESCTTPRGLAFPPRRLLSVAQGLQARGSTTVAASICESGTYAQAADVMLRAAIGQGFRRCFADAPIAP